MAAYTGLCATQKAISNMVMPICPKMSDDLLLVGRESYAHPS